MGRNEEDAERWIERGNDAWRKVSLAETTRCFGNAVAADPRSVEARLGFGVANSFLYTNGCNEARNLLFEYSGKYGSPKAELVVRGKLANAAQAELNETYGKVAEENLLEASRLDNHNKAALLHLAGLYHYWISDMDLLGQTNRPRLNEARKCYMRILEIDPEDGYAYYARGAVAYEMGRALIPPNLVLSTATMSEESRQSIQERSGQLLDESFEDLSRSLELNPDDLDSLTFLAHVRTLQGRFESTAEKRSRAKQEAHDFTDRANSIRGPQTAARSSATIVFRRVSSSEEEAAGPLKRCFPPERPYMRIMAPPLPPTLRPKP